MKDKYLEESFILDINDTDFSGKVIELKRLVELEKYNDYETEAKSIDWTIRTDSENEEFNIVAWRILKAFYDKFILTATDYGLTRYERLLGIEADGDLEARRRKVFFYWNKKIRYTHRTLCKMLDILVGINQYELELVYDDYALILDIYIYKNLDADTLYSILREIIPANLSIEFRVNARGIINIKDKTATYVNRLYPVGSTHQTGTIYEQQYTGSRVVDKVKVPNNTDTKPQRPVYVNEQKAKGGKK